MDNSVFLLEFNPGGRVLNRTIGPSLKPPPRLGQRVFDGLEVSSGLREELPTMVGIGPDDLVVSSLVWLDGEKLVD